MLRTTLVVLITIGLRVTASGSGSDNGQPVWNPAPDVNRTTMGCVPFTVAKQTRDDLPDSLGGALCASPRQNRGLDVVYKADERLNMDVKDDSIANATWGLQPIECPGSCSLKDEATASGGCWKYAGQQTVPWTSPDGKKQDYKVAVFEVVVLIFLRGQQYQSVSFCSATCLGFDALHC